MRPIEEVGADLGADVLHGFGGQGVPEVGVDEAGPDRVDADRSQLQCERLRQALDGCEGRGDRGQAELGPRPGAAGEQRHGASGP